MNLTGNRTWLLPVWLQLLCPVTIAISILFLPESPRWLYVNKRETAAMDVITKYHGVSNPESVWVKLQKQEYHRYLKPNGAVRHSFVNDSHTNAHTDRIKTGGTTVSCSAIDLQSIVWSVASSLLYLRSLLATLF